MLGTIIGLIMFGCIVFIVYTFVMKKDNKKKKSKESCADGSCDKPVVPLVINVTLKPNNEGTKVPEGVFCTRTKEIVATEEITGNDCGDCVKREWFDNGVVNPNFNGLIKIPPPFYTGHEIKYKVSIGNISKEVSVKIK